MKTSTILATAAIAGTLGLSAIQPAKADTASTTDIILGAAAVVAGIAISENVAHKQAQANTVTGYTPWGATVYADGHVVLPNGQSYYPGNVGQQIACNGTACTITQNGVAVGYGGYGPGQYGYNGYNQGYNNQGYYNPNNNGTYYNPNNTGYYAPSSATPRAIPVRHNNVYASSNGRYVSSDGRYVAASTRYVRVNSVSRNARVARDNRDVKADKDRKTD